MEYSPWRGNLKFKICILLILSFSAFAELNKEEAEIVENLDFLASMDYLEQDEWNPEDLELFIQDNTKE